MRLLTASDDVSVFYCINAVVPVECYVSYQNTTRRYSSNLVANPHKRHLVVTPYSSACLSHVLAVFLSDSLASLWRTGQEKARINLLSGCVLNSKQFLPPSCTRCSAEKGSYVMSPIQTSKEAFAPKVGQ